MRLLRCECSVIESECGTRRFSAERNHGMDVSKACVDMKEGSSNVVGINVT